MTEIPDVICVEPVFPTVDAEESVWVECRCEWDSNREVFINYESEPEWVLDDHSYPDSEYYVGDATGEVYSSFDEAAREALSGRTEVPENITVFHAHSMDG